MTRLLKRRQFIQGTIGAAASIGLSNLRAQAHKFHQSDEYIEALVIGSGFGGGVASLRLGEAGIETIVLERGRRWNITDAGNTFSPYDKPDGRAAFLNPTSLFFNAGAPIDIYTGILSGKIAVGNTISALNGAGVGGTSLVYGGITYQPPERFFYQVFPNSIKYSELDSIYYPRVRSILKATPIPDDILQSPYYLSSSIFLEQAAKAGLKTRKIPIAFDWDIVRQEIAGKKKPSIISGQYYYGAESGAKNSVDRNYLKMAEKTGYVEIRPLHVVTEISEFRDKLYRVVCNQINEKGEVLAQKHFICRYLFLAAGSIGTTELLVRAREERTLPRLSYQIGFGWGTNADSVTTVISNKQTNPTFGTPGVVAIEHFDNPIAPVLLEPFPVPSVPQGAAIILGQGITKPEGYFTYNASTKSTDLFWPSTSPNNQKLAKAIQYTYQLINQANGTSLAGPPDFSSTGHPLGGAVIGQVCDTYGQVYGYRNLFIVDGSLIPASSACVNPSLTIAALAERSMDRFLNDIGKHYRRW
ncbi:GMC family oxidoreductase [Nostocaceae cyanobacterium CENA369]|uniref:Cholesterol oxidase n=1 Tax=Dendronalium phyllosphericum CENA369 TaxID=1725256 RepID=A0A8J7IBX4_9NOST|nr:GMC oxidoreductase [Dendronalium phyllosphericum]MBH8576290.1 GMC family oxidoreductase [Dendronalium phyllosphericum CENA369]